MSLGEPNNTIVWRVGSLERRVDRLYDLEPAVVAQQVKDLHGDITDLRRDVKAMTRALWGFGLSVAGGAVLFVIAAFQVLP